MPCINVKIMIPVSQWNLSVQTTLKELSSRGLRGAVFSHQVTMDDNAHSFQTTLKKLSKNGLKGRTAYAEGFVNMDLGKGVSK